MGVRPPSGGDDEPESIEFGIAAVDARLRRTDLPFPATDREVAAALGDEEIAYDVHGNTVALREILEDVERDSFEDRQELLNALHPAFERYRKNRGGSVVKQVRSFLPF